MKLDNFEKLNLRSPARADAIAAIDQVAQPPSDYLEFLRMSDGGEGFVGDGYLMLFSVEEIERINRAASIEKYAPGLLIFGSDGGGKSFAFDYRRNPTVIVEIYDMDIGDEEPVFCADSFEGFLSRLQGLVATDSAGQSGTDPE